MHAMFMRGQGGKPQIGRLVDGDSRVSATLDVDPGQSEAKVLRFLLTVSVINGLVCTVAPGWVLVRPGGADAQVGHLIYILAAIVALALTPMQLVALWLVLGGRLRAVRANKRISVRVREVLRREAIQTAFQPIFDLVTRRVVGVEALARFTVEPVATPDVWFADAEMVGHGRPMELLAIRTALGNSAALPNNLYIALNVSPSTLASPQLLATLLESGVPPDRLVVEVTEHTSIPDYAPLQEARARLRHHGIRLSVDDAGSGYASFRHIVALAPDIIKLDRALIAGLDHDEARRALVAAVVMYALQSGAVLVAEGIENAVELAALESLGVDSAQGYHLGRPTTCPEDWQTWGGATIEPSPAIGRPLRPRPDQHPAEGKTTAIPRSMVDRRTDLAG
jgi:EAL domain-containing protein (putative c-di-GMP-specific phosphodiesterase class I)